MKKNFIEILVLLCIIAMIFFISCSRKERSIDNDNEQETIVENESIEKVEAETDNNEASLSDLSILQPRGIKFNNENYIALNGGIYKIDNNDNKIEIFKCQDAVGRIHNGYLYWAIVDEDNKIQVIRMDQTGEILEVGGEISNEMFISHIDFYKDILYIRYKIGSVEGYHIDSTGKIGEKASIEEMLIYEEENKAADIRINNPEDIASILETPYHLVDAGYSQEVYGKQFMARHHSNGEEGYEEAYIKKDGIETVLFRFYDKVILHENNIIYISSVWDNEISIYSLDDHTNHVVYSFRDGSFDLSYASSDMAYGIWSSFENGKNFYVGIDLVSAEMKVFFEADDDVEYIQLENHIYYVSTESQTIVEIELDEINNLDIETNRQN